MSKTKFEDIEFTGGYTLLMLKAEEGNFDEVQRMIAELKHLDVDAANKKGYTALALAVKAGHSDVVRLLIASGANPDLKNNSGQSPLFLACWNNHEQIMEILLDNGVEINTIDHRGWTPLMIAAYHGHRHIVRELLLRKADASIQDLFGKKAVDRAKDPEIIRMLQGGSLSKANYASPRLKEKGNLPYSPGRTAAVEQRTQESQLSSILKKSSSRISVGALKAENERNQPHLSPETVQETGPSGKKGAAPGKIADKKAVEQRKGSGQQKVNQPTKKEAQSTGTGKSTPVGRPDVGGTISPSKSQNSRRVSNSPTSALDRQMFKEDIIYLINEQMDQVGPKMQQIIENKIALEIPMQMQTHENQFKKQVETVLRYKATDIFKNLQAIFNLKLKFCLTKLGYDTNELGMNNFLESESGFDPETINFGKEPLRAYNEKEFKAISNDINRLEKAVLSNKIPEQAGVRKTNSPSRNKSGGEQCDHTSQLHRTEIRNEVFDHVGHEIRSTTEYLLEYSHGRVGEMAREESGMLYKKIMAEVTDNMEALEDELKRKFEEIINFKMNKIIEVLGSAAQSGALNENPKTFEKGFSKNYSSTGNAASGKYKADIGRVEPTASSVYSDRRATENRSKSGQIESSQAKDRIMKLKNSLNFMDESGEQRVDKLRQSGGGMYQSQERGTYDEEEEVERAPEPEAAEEENDEEAEVERIYNPSYRSTLKGESVQSGQSGQREYWSPGLNRANSGSKSKTSQQPQGRGTADSKSNQKSKQIPGHRVEPGGEQEMMKYYDFSNE